MAVEVSRHQAAWPCDSCDCVSGVAPEKRWHTPRHIEATDVCYRQAITETSELLLSLFAHNQQGHLYCAGGLRDQPAIYLQAMMFLQGYLRDNKD